MAKQDTKGAADKTSTKAAESVDYDKWTDEQIGFAPYFKPIEEAWFAGMAVAIDVRDPKFIRYQFVAAEDTECQRGPADENNPRAEKLIVKKGERFSVSCYYTLRDIFDEYLNYGADTGVGMIVRVDCLQKVPTKNQPAVWQFRARLSPEQSKLMNAWRMKHRKVLPAPAQRAEIEE